MKKKWFVLMFVTTIIAALVILYFGVIRYYQEISEQQALLKENQGKIEKIIAKKDEVPSQLWIEQYKTRQANLDAEISKCKNYYKDTDKVLEKWFTGLTIGKDGLPSEGDFKVKYIAEKNTLIKQLKDKKIYDISEDGDQSEEGKNLGFGEPKVDNLQKLQKQFWIQQKLFADMLKSNVTKCEKLNFPPLTKPKSDVLFCSVIPFSITVLIQNKDIPIFIYNILKIPDSKEALSLFILIENASTSRLTQEINELPEIKELGKTIPEIDKGNYKPSPVRLPLSRLSVEGEVLDFDFSSELIQEPKKDKPEERKSKK